MKTIILNIPEKEEIFFLTVFKKFRLNPTVLTNEDLEDKELARWIEEGLKSEDIPMEKVFKLLEQHGAKG